MPGTVLETVYLVLAYFLAAFFLVTGGIKVLGYLPATDRVPLLGFLVRWSRGQRDKLGVAPGLWYAIGALEWAAVVGLLLGVMVMPALAVAAGAGLVLLLIGATIYRVRVRDWTLLGAPNDVLMVVVLAAFTGLAATQ